MNVLTTLDLDKPSLTDALVLDLKPSINIGAASASPEVDDLGGWASLAEKEASMASMRATIASLGRSYDSSAYREPEPVYAAWNDDE